MYNFQKYKISNHNWQQKKLIIHTCHQLNRNKVIKFDVNAGIL